MVLPPSRDDVNEMDRLSRILKGERPAPTAASATTSAGAPDPNAFIIQHGPTAEDTASMANIMRNFSKTTGVESFRSLHDKANKVVSTLVNEAQNEPTLRDALVTEQTETGIRVGAWEISKHTREGDSTTPETFYRVHNTNTAQRIKAAFLISESALTVVKLLNEGANMQHPTIRQIARYELDYRQARKKTLEEKRSYNRAKKTGSNFKQDLYEAKFDAAKMRALLIRERVINLYITL